MPVTIGLQRHQGKSQSSSSSSSILSRFRRPSTRRLSVLIDLLETQLLNGSILECCLEPTGNGSVWSGWNLSTKRISKNDLVYWARRDSSMVAVGLSHGHRVCMMTVRQVPEAVVAFRPVSLKILLPWTEPSCYTTSENKFRRHCESSPGGLWMDSSAPSSTILALSWRAASGCGPKVSSGKDGSLFTKGKHLVPWSSLPC